MKYQESTSVELKQEVVDDIKKEIIAFANTNGGILFIGIADNGDIVGITDVDETSLQISNMIRDSIKPDVTMFVNYEILQESEKSILKITIQRGTERPYYLAKKGLKPEGVYVRQGNSSVPSSESAIRRLIKETDGDSFEGVRSMNQELTFQVTEKEFKQRGLAFSENQMITLGLLSSERIYTNLGLLLSDQCMHLIKAASFEGTNKSQFKDRREFSGSLLNQLQDVYDFIDLHNKMKSEFLGLHRIDKRDYPEVALREALLNSLVHRDYSFSASILVSIFDDRIEFVSVGGLVKGITLNDIMFGVSVCRNEKLAGVFYRLQLIEAYGTGIQKIMESYANISVKPQVEVSDNAFRITLPNCNAITNRTNIENNEKIILKLFNEKDVITRKDVETILGVSQTMAGRILKQMIEKNLISTIGKGNKTRYIKG